MTRAEVETRAKWAAASLLGSLGVLLEALADRLIGIPPGVQERHEISTYFDD